jgi:leucyl-tRNA synthetase
VAAAPLDEEAETDTAFMRERLSKWCENGVSRITGDMAELQMHKAVRNLTRLFERIQDYEKRVVKRRGQLSRADAEALADALVLLTRVLAPLAPHIAEALLLEAGREDDVELLASWPQLLEALS